MITLNSGVVKALTVEAEVSGKKTQVSIDVANKNASCRIDLTEPVAQGATPTPYAGGRSDVHVSVTFDTAKDEYKPLVSTTNVIDVDGASAISKLAIAKIKDVVIELGI